MKNYVLYRFVWEFCRKYHGVFIFTFVSLYYELKLKNLGFKGRQKIKKLSSLGQPTEYVYEFNVFHSETPCIQNKKKKLFQNPDN